MAARIIFKFLILEMRILMSSPALLMHIDKIF